MKSDATERWRLEQSHYQKLGSKIKNNTKVIIFFYTYAWVNTIGPEKMSSIIHTVLFVSQDYYHAHLYSW